MEFTLTYAGQLKSNGSLQHKHQIRKCFDKQLKVLWRQKPLADFKPLVCGPLGPAIPRRNALVKPGALVKDVGGHFFAPLVAKHLSLTCQLDVTMLRHGEPGTLLVQGDIDNRLKTLFDALALPNTRQIPRGEPQNSRSDPILCLLEDDVLVTGVRVECDRLLEDCRPTQVLLLIHVKVHRAHVTDANRGMPF